MILSMENQSTGRETLPTVTWDKVHTRLTMLISKSVTSVFPFFLFFNIHSLFIFLLFSFLTEFFLYLIWVTSYCYNYKFRVPYLFIYCLFMTKFEGRRLLGRGTEWAGIRLKMTGQNLCESEQHSPGSGREYRTRVSRLEIFRFHKLRVITWTSQAMFFENGFICQYFVVWVMNNVLWICWKHLWHNARYYSTIYRERLRKTLGLYNWYTGRDLN